MPSDRPRATVKQANEELLACLILVAPTGMTAEDRAVWIGVARQTLTGIPADLLSQGCAAARRKCKFASEIVPAILKEIEPEWDRRKRIIAEREAVERAKAEPKLPEPENVDAAEVTKLIETLSKRIAA